MLTITCTDSSVYYLQGEPDLAMLGHVFVSVSEMARIDPTHSFTRCQTLADFLAYLGY